MFAIELVLVSHSVRYKLQLINICKIHFIIRSSTSGPPGFAATGMTGHPANLVFSKVFCIFFVICKSMQIHIQMAHSH